MATQSRLVRAIEVLIPMDKHSHVHGYWIYARIPHHNYGYNTIDELDEVIFEDISAKAKKDEFKWYRKEVDKGWAHYSMVDFRPYHNRFDKNIQITSELPDTNLTLQERAIIAAHGFPEIRSAIHFLAAKKLEEDDEIYIPPIISGSMDCKLLLEKHDTYVPYF